MVCSNIAIYIFISYSTFYYNLIKSLLVFIIFLIKKVTNYVKLKKYRIFDSPPAYKFFELCLNRIVFVLFIYFFLKKNK